MSSTSKFLRDLAKKTNTASAARAVLKATHLKSGPGASAIRVRGFRRLSFPPEGTVLRRKTLKRVLRTGAWIPAKSRPGTDHERQIKGYASTDSVALGEAIDFHVALEPAGTFTITVYRLGYYDGASARRVLVLPNAERRPATGADSRRGDGPHRGRMAGRLDPGHPRGLVVGNLCSRPRQGRRLPQLRPLRRPRRRGLRRLPRRPALDELAGLQLVAARRQHRPQRLLRIRHQGSRGKRLRAQSEVLRGRPRLDLQPGASHAGLLRASLFRLRTPGRLRPRAVLHPVGRGHGVRPHLRHRP